MVFLLSEVLVRQVFSCCVFSACAMSTDKIEKRIQDLERLRARELEATVFLTHELT